MLMHDDLGHTQLHRPHTHTHLIQSSYTILYHQEDEDVTHIADVLPWDRGLLPWLIAASRDVLYDDVLLLDFPEVA